MIGKRLLIVTSRQNLAQQDVVFAGANPRDPRIVYARSRDDWMCLPVNPKQPWLVIVGSHFTEKELKELYVRYGEPTTLKAGLEAVGIPRDER